MDENVEVQVRKIIGDSSFAYLLGSSNREILEALHRLEKHMALQDEKITQFETDMKGKLTAIGTSLDGQAASLTHIADAQANIAADEKNILAELEALRAGSDLSPENVSKLNGLIEMVTASSTKAEANATALSDAAASLQTLADTLPDTQPPPPASTAQRR